MSIYNRDRMILAGDIGGTKTLLGLFEPVAPRPRQLAVSAYPTTDYDGLPAMVDAFLREHDARPRIDAAAFGVAGPVIGQVARMTNVPWEVDARELTRSFAFDRVRLLNDLEAMAWSVPVLERDELRPLQAGDPSIGGNIALVAAGTGLGQAVLHRLDDRHVPVPSEGGHADFAARSDRELALVRFLRDRFARAEIEHVLSGPGLVNLADFTHLDGPCTAVDDGAPDHAADVSGAALEGRCARCREALDLFVGAYGAVAGNLALTAVTTGGVYIGGGIAPKILPALIDGRFVAAFTDKGPMRAMMEGMPVFVILNPETGLLGAAVVAARS